MRKYILAINNTLQTYFIYRLNFIMWRVRTVIRLLTSYFFWLAVFHQGGVISGYDRQMMLTYVLISSVVWAITMASRSVDISGEIASGDLVNYLLKPIKYFRYWFFRDLADKFLNIIFVIVEMCFILYLLKPPFFLQTNLLYLFLFLFISFLALIIYFLLSCLVSLTTFWYPTHSGWPARFLFEIILIFLAGGLFPLDILPPAIYRFLKLLPFSYMIFFPIGTYLGRITSGEIVLGISIMIFWIIALYWILHFVWMRGLRIYESYGR